MTRYRVIVVVSNGVEFIVETKDEDEARDKAIDAAYEQHPFMDEYQIAWEPEVVA